MVESAKDLKKGGYNIDDDLPEKLVIIWLNAWQYADALSLWRAFILRIATELEERGLAGSTEEWETKLYYSISQDAKADVKLSNSAITLAAVGAVMMFAASLLLPSTWILMLFANLGLGSNTNFKLPSVDKLFEQSKYTKLRKQMDSTEQFRAELQPLINRLLRRHGDDLDDKHKVIFLIDDLDRCTPAVALEIMETIKTFLDVTGCVYVLLCDERLIGQGVKNKFRELFGDGEAAYQQRGREYIEKIIQISFNIPPVNEKMLSDYAVSAMSDMQKKGVIGLSYFDIVRAAVGDNPRKIKRLCRDLELGFRMMELALGKPVTPPASNGEANPPASGGSSTSHDEAQVTEDGPPVGTESRPTEATMHRAPSVGDPDRVRAFAKTFCLQYRWPQAMVVLRKYQSEGRVGPLRVPAAVKALSGSQRDVTNWTGAERNLREAESKLTSLLENKELQLFADLLVTVDWERAPAMGEGAIKLLNPDLSEFLQIQPGFTSMDGADLRNYIEWSGVIGREHPVPETTEPATTSSKVDVPTVEAGPRLAGKRILWVDNQPENNVRAVGSLKGEGAEVVLSTTTSEALEEARLRPFDAIITDQRRDENGSPNDMAGYDLLRELRERQVQAPVILSTASPDVRQAGEAGFYAATNSDGVFEYVLQAIGGSAQVRESDPDVPPFAD